MGVSTQYHALKHIRINRSLKNFRQNKQSINNFIRHEDFKRQTIKMKRPMRKERMNKQKTKRTFVVE